MNTVRVPFLDLKLQYSQLRDSMAAPIAEVLDNAAYIEGAPVAKFETAFAEYCGTKFCIAVDSGTAALHLGLLALGIGPGDEVIVPASTFIATAAAVAMVGARPVFVDADEHNWQADVRQIARKIGPRTKAVIAVHLYGQPAAIQEMADICRKSGVFFIEDAAQAHGAKYNGTRVGSFGELSCFSFYPGKNLGAYGDGGAINTNNAALAEKLIRLRNHGRLTKYEHAEVGYNYRMDAIQGAVLGVKLRHLDDWNAKRRYWAHRYREELSSLPVTLPAPIPQTEPVYHLFTLLTDDRDGLGKHLSQNDIENGIHYPVPLHLQPAFSHLGHRRGDFPVSERIGDHTISLPMFPEMTEEQFRHVASTVRAFVANAAVVNA